MSLLITHFTDPACPFAFSAEPKRLRLRWHYGEGLEWRTRMIVLTREEGEAENLAQGAAGLQRKYGMPIDPRPHSRPASSEPACRAVVATRLNAPEREEDLLRALRVRTMAGDLLDEPKLLEAAADDARLDYGELGRWIASEETAAALEDDAAAARSPDPAARALDHKLSGPEGQRRYPAPSYKFRTPDGAATVAAGFHPVEVYEVAIANLSPGLERRPAPEDVRELLEWAPYPLATAEVTEICGISPPEARAELARVAEPIASGADFFWRLPT